MAETQSRPGQGAAPQDHSSRLDWDTSSTAAIRKLRAALAYAQLGWRVHPCAPGTKYPLLERWPERATTDLTIVAKWWANGTANIAVATGRQSDIFVLDCDGPEGEASLVELERTYGPLPALFPHQWTGGGRAGWQAFFAYPEGRQIGNSAGRLGPKLDTRGEGGYVLVPPSVTTNAYRWSSSRSPWAIQPPPPPDWLVDLLDPPEAPAPEIASRFDPLAYHKPEQSDRYGWRAMESELALVATASEGRRNDQLNRSAHALYRLVADGRLYRADVDHALAAAGRHVGLTDREITATISSAARARGLSS